MLAKKRSVKIDGQEVERTPLLVPSFSSKGFPDVNKIIRATSEVLDGPALVSAYDLHYEKIEPPFEFATLLFLDSGGYEAGKDVELSDVGDRDHEPKEWTMDMHGRTIANWRPEVPTVLVGYDHPKHRCSFQKQVERTVGMSWDHGEFARAILLKPETEDQDYLQLDAILNGAHLLSQFQVVGITEKEIGNNILDRMVNIARLRNRMNEIGLADTPIHVFGSLDTISTPLYFVSGADIFDGLTWLRYAYRDGLTIYRHNFAALDLSLGTKTHLVDGQCWFKNYYYIQSLQDEMRRYLLDGDFGCFRHNSQLFRTAYESMRERLES